MNAGWRVCLVRPTLLRPLERALAAASWGVVALALALLTSRLICRRYPAWCYEAGRRPHQAAAAWLVARGRRAGRDGRPRRADRHYPQRPGKARLDAHLWDGARRSVCGQRHMSHL